MRLSTTASWSQRFRYPRERGGSAQRRQIAQQLWVQLCRDLDKQRSDRRVHRLDQRGHAGNQAKTQSANHGTAAAASRIRISPFLEPRHAGAVRLASSGYCFGCKVDDGSLAGRKIFPTALKKRFPFAALSLESSAGAA